MERREASETVNDVDDKGLELDEEKIRNIDRVLALGYKKDNYGRRRGISQENIERIRK